MPEASSVREEIATTKRRTRISEQQARERHTKRMALLHRALSTPQPTHNTEKATLLSPSASTPEEIHRVNEIRTLTAGMMKDAETMRRNAPVHEFSHTPPDRQVASSKLGNNYEGKEAGSAPDSEIAQPSPEISRLTINEGVGDSLITREQGALASDFTPNIVQKDVSQDQIDRFLQDQSRIGKLSERFMNWFTADSPLFTSVTRRITALTHRNSLSDEQDVVSSVASPITISSDFQPNEAQQFAAEQVIAHSPQSGIDKALDKMNVHTRAPLTAGLERRIAYITHSISSLFRK